MSSTYDGNGLKVKEVASGNQNATTYYLRSTVVKGQIVEEVNSSGQKVVGYVYHPDGGQLARQRFDSVTWQHDTPANTSRYYTTTSGFSRTEFDPLGADVA
jgi:hypothetical protein